jgi:hypothetical protein
MAVVDTRGTDIGRVAEADLEHFVVERGALGVTTLSYDAVRAILGDQVVLDTGPDLNRGV